MKCPTETLDKFEQAVDITLDKLATEAKATGTARNKNRLLAGHRERLHS